MSYFLRFDKTDSDIGLCARSIVAGPESDMVNEFVEQYAASLAQTRKHYASALFFEPLLPTGYPDLVVVDYDPSAYTRWEPRRGSLQILDLKILHHLHFSRGSTSEAAMRQLGLGSRQLLKSLELLMDSGLVERKKQRWVPARARTTYGIKAIKAIEAKISDWGSVFGQAGLNRLFASESFVLSPVAQPSPSIVERADAEGIGIISLPSGRRAQTIHKPRRSPGMPVSYASWLFNEWIGRRLVQNHGGA